MDSNQNQTEEQRKFEEDNSLENPTTVESSSPSEINATGGPTTPLEPLSNEPASKPPKHGGPLDRLFSHSNVYLLVFIALLITAVGVVLAAIVIGHGKSQNTVQTQAVTKQTLQQLAISDVSVGQPKQVLNVQSNAVFAGQVLVRGGLDIAGKLQVGDSLSLPDLAVTGTSVLSTAQIQKNLSVSGDSALQGQLNVQKTLSVAGGGTFGGNLSAGQISTSNLQLNGDLGLSHHIITSGGTPSRSTGNALGSGGSASVSGSDTAGTVNVNTGSSAAAGCFASLTFAQRYTATPHVIISPVGSAAADSGYYVNRSNTGFSICATTPPSGASFAFDYFVAG